jgi:hypothetical protein
MVWQEISRIPTRISSSLRLVEVPEEALAVGRVEGWAVEQGLREEWAALAREAPEWDPAGRVDLAQAWEAVTRVEAELAEVRLEPLQAAEAQAQAVRAPAWNRAKSVHSQAAKKEQAQAR